MTKFGHFHRNFPSKPKLTQPNLKKTIKLILYQPTTLLIGFFLRNLDKERFMVVLIPKFQTSHKKFPNLDFLLLLFFLFLYSFSLLLFSLSPSLCLNNWEPKMASPSSTMNPSQMREKSLLIRPCLVLSYFCSKFLIFPLSPSSSFYLKINLSYFQLSI